MKEISKLKKIYKGFFPDETVSEERKTRRRDACNSCEYNSKNVTKEKLGAVDFARSMITNDFCTLCKCQIFEKTQSPYEECAMYILDADLKWNKTRIENMDDSMNITNLSETEVGISGENNIYTIDYGVIDSTSVTEVELLVDSKSSESFSIKSVSPTCGCAISKFSDTSDNKGTISLRLDLSMINSDRFVKEVPVVYHLGTKPIRETLRLTGFKK